MWFWTTRPIFSFTIKDAVRIRIIGNDIILGCETRFRHWTFPAECGSGTYNSSLWFWGFDTAYPETSYRTTFWICCFLHYFVSRCLRVEESKTAEGAVRLPSLSKFPTPTRFFFSSCMLNKPCKYCHFYSLCKLPEVMQAVQILNTSVHYTLRYMHKPLYSWKYTVHFSINIHQESDVLFCAGGWSGDCITSLDVIISPYCIKCLDDDLHRNPFVICTRYRLVFKCIYTCPPSDFWHLLFDRNLCRGTLTLSPMSLTCWT